MMRVGPRSNLLRGPFCVVFIGHHSAAVHSFAAMTCEP
jgi:hypothetical protein